MSRPHCRRVEACAVYAFALSVAYLAAALFGG
jgi:hypothetical protein